ELLQTESSAHTLCCFKLWLNLKSEFLDALAALGMVVSRRAIDIVSDSDTIPSLDVWIFISKPFSSEII
ncbi:MAG: hypothetical protein WCF14_09075, partial [Nitrososphaeraceae archaeon]